jgi:purine-binding chemotaxis protein CheW
MSEMLKEAIMDEEDTQQGKFLTFTLGKEVFGLEIRHVTEIVGIQKINTIPESPGYIKGIINLRGKIIPVIDMRLRLKKEPEEYTDRTCIIVVEIQDITIGLVVDSVAEVITIADELISPPPDIRTGLQSRYIEGIAKVDEGIILLLDNRMIISDADIDELIMTSDNNL